MKQLDKKSVWLFFFSYIIRWIIFIPFLAGFAASISSVSEDFNVLVFVLVILLVLIFITALCYVWAKLSYHYYRYQLTDLGFRKESGVIYKKYVTIPYDRIQNVDINRGILARLLGLSDLHIQTAGASAVIGRYGISGVGTEGRLPGISKADAELLRDDLVIRARGSRSQGL